MAAKSSIINIYHRSIKIQNGPYFTDRYWQDAANEKTS
jgi:hypothetical protein